MFGDERVFDNCSVRALIICDAPTATSGSFDSIGPYVLCNLSHISAFFSLAQSKRFVIIVIRKEEVYSWYGDTKSADDVPEESCN